MIQLMMLKCHLDNYQQGVENMTNELQQTLGLGNALRNTKIQLS